MAPARSAAPDGVLVLVGEPLRFLLPRRGRAGALRVPHDPAATAGHVAQSAGVPLTEVGRILLDGVPVPPGARVPAGARLELEAVRRPQPVPAGGFLLDVHHGTLARRLRLLGLDAAYRNDATDPELVARAVAEDRVLLTQDRGLLMRRALPRGALVRGRHPQEQLADVLDRFAPALAPLTRCPACNGALHAVATADVADRLPAGTLRSYEEFRRCGGCDRVYWRGAHAGRIALLVEEAVRRASPSPGAAAGAVVSGPERGQAGSMSGREDEQHGIPNPETGAGVGAVAEGTTFEPEETTGEQEGTAPQEDEPLGR